MARVCEITGKKPQVANNVSHAMNKTKRRQLPNLQVRSMPSQILGCDVSLRISTNAIRTIDKYGSIDNFMLTYKRAYEFSENAKKIRAKIRKKAAASAN